MPTLPPEAREVVLADLKVAHDEIKRAKFLLDRKDPQQLEAWNALDQADALLQGLSFYLGHTP